MNREATYGNSLRQLKEIRDELEQRQVDMDQLEEELESGYALLEEQQEMIQEQTAELKRTKDFANNELMHHNKLHPHLMTKRYIDGNNITTRTPEDALLIRVLSPSVGFDEENDRALIKFIHGRANNVKTEIYAISLGTFKETRYDLLEDAIKETAEKVNTELWDIVKENIKHG